MTPVRVTTCKIYYNHHNGVFTEWRVVGVESTGFSFVPASDYVTWTFDTVETARFYAKNLIGRRFDGIDIHIANDSVLYGWTFAEEVNNK